MLRFLSFVLLAAFAASVFAADPNDHTGAKGYSGIVQPKYKLRILLSNDDSWASSNIRAFYYALKTAGHQVLLVAPVINQSGTGGTVVLPKSQTLPYPGRNNSVNQGAPYHGSEPYDKGINYVDSSPAASVLYALDQVAPAFFNNQDPQLIVSGPNEGTNLGSFLYTLSGTIGNSYVGTERGIPGAAFSANTKPRDYHETKYDDPNDPAIILGTNAANVVAALTNVVPQGQRLAPLGIGANVNFGSNFALTSCNGKRAFKQTRLTGGAYVDKIIISNVTNLPTYQNINTDAMNVCYSGDDECKLPGEQTIYNQEACTSTISIYDIDYTAPSSAYVPSKDVQQFSQAIKTLNVKPASKRNVIARED